MCHHTEYALQVAAYARAYEEMTGETVDEGWVVRLDKRKPKFEAKRVKDLDECFESFLCSLRLWRHVKQNLFEGNGGVR